MTRDQILQVMRRQADPEPMWAQIRASAQPGRASAAILEAFRDAVHAPDQKAVSLSAQKNPEMSGRIYFEATIMAVLSMRHDKEKAKKIAYRLADELAEVIANPKPVEPEVAAQPVEPEVAAQSEPESSEDPSWESPDDAGAYYDDAYPDEPGYGDPEGFDADVPFGDVPDEVPATAPEPFVKPVIDPNDLKGEPVRRDLPESEIGRDLSGVDKPDRAGFSTAPIPDRRPIFTIMLPPPPSADSDPDMISAWAASQPSSEFAIGYRHAKGRGPKDAEIMDAEVAFYNGPDVIMKDAGMVLRMDPEEAGIEDAAAEAFSGFSEETPDDEALRGIFTTCYDAALRAWNPKHAEALAWSGAELIFSDGLMRALRAVSAELPLGEPGDGGRSRMSSNGSPTFSKFCERAVALFVSRGVPLHEALLSSRFECRVVAERMPDDPAILWERMLSAPRDFFPHEAKELVSAP